VCFGNHCGSVGILSLDWSFCEELRLSNWFALYVYIIVGTGCQGILPSFIPLSSVLLFSMALGSSVDN